MSSLKVLAATSAVLVIDPCAAQGAPFAALPKTSPMRFLEKAPAKVER